MKPPLKAAAPALALALLITGCSAGGSDGSNGGKDQEQGSGSSSAAEASSDTTEVAATATWPYSSSDGEAEVQIHELKARGKLLQLTLTVTAGRVGDADAESLYHLWGNYGLSPALVDTANLKRHEVVEDSDGDAMKPDVVYTELVFGEPHMLSYTFAAPPDGVQAMDVYVNEYPPVTDVPIVR